jgi:hypothetical protein
MQTNLCTLLLLLFCSLAYSQKVDIDNSRITVEYASLPIHKTSPDQKTYSLEVTGDYKFDTQAIGDALNLRGWAYVPENGTVHAKLRVSNFVRGGATYNTEEKVTKDKEGKVTNRWKEYTYRSSNVGMAYLYIYGPLNGYVPPAKETKSSVKAKERAAAKEEAKAKEKADNPFLKDVDTDVAAAEPEDSENNLAAKYDLTQRYEVTGAQCKSLKEALNSYNASAAESYANQLEAYANKVINNTNYSLNKTYGYNRHSDRVKFKTLGSKKHPEYEMFNNATDAMKAILATKKFNQNTSEVIAAMEPIAGYFRSVADKNGSDDKQQERLKAACLYNIAQIYYYLDMPDKVIGVGNEFIAWDYDVKIGKNFIEKAERLKHLLDFHGVPGRFFETNEDANAVEAEVSEDDNSDEGEGEG